jgi:hypothetical protein
MFICCYRNTEQNYALWKEATRSSRKCSELKYLFPIPITETKKKNRMLLYIDPLLGNEREIIDYTRIVSR